MYISKIRIQNFRLLSDSTLFLDDDFKKELTLLIGRNNTGKTSFIALFEKFFSRKPLTFYDFPKKVRDQLLHISDSTNINELATRIILEIVYFENDSLKELSEFLLDLDPKENKVNILLEYSLNKKRLLKDLKSIVNRKTDFLKKSLSNYLEPKLYAFTLPIDFNSENRPELIKKDWKALYELLNIQVIHAKRDVASSEAEGSGKQILSSMTSKLFNQEYKASHDTMNSITSAMIDLDKILDQKYADFFTPFLEAAKNFLNLKNLNVLSDLQSREIVANFSKVVYEDLNATLPEHLNGLGHMNVLYLLLCLEFTKKKFESDSSPLNLLFIEEPEAHTHPQMQYIFIQRVNEFLDNIPNLQTILTSHSAHIVQNCNFKDIRYFHRSNTPDNVVIRNFFKELKSRYQAENPDDDRAEKANFRFLTQYLTLTSSELFFAEKIIFIEGISEKILLPYFVREFDKSRESSDPKLPVLSTQNISVIEAGANAKAFRHFIEILGIKTLIITDIDTTKREIKETKKGKKTVYVSEPVNGSTHTSNETIKYYLKAPAFDSSDFRLWFKNLKAGKLSVSSPLIRLAYQKQEKKYQARSFEEAFLQVNLPKIKELANSLEGLQNIEELACNSIDFFTLTNKIFKPNGKAAFASSILYQALSGENTSWKLPQYIKEAFEWIVE